MQPVPMSCHPSRARRARAHVAREATVLGAVLCASALAPPALAQTATPAAPASAERWVPHERALAAGTVEGSRWSAQFSPFSVHANPSSDHAHPVAFGLRRSLGTDDFVGASLFRNSFGQPSVYGFYGQRLHGGVPALPRFYVEWTAGLMHGYVGDRSDEVPLNVRGVSPVFTISPGWQISPQLSAQVNVIGTVAVMLQFDWRLR
jgi:hypothetical protein